MIKVVCFDLDGVYFVNGKRNFIANLAKWGVSKEKAVEVFLKSGKMNREYKTGKIGDEEYWQWALNEWGLQQVSVSEIISLLIRGYEINEQAVQMVKKLRGGGYQTAICSNNFPARINGLNNRFGFLADFDTAVFSYEMGVLKPERKIFEELGIQTFVYRDFSQFCGELERLGVRV